MKRVFIQPYQSTEEKRPIFKTVTYVRIVSGGGLSEIDRPMYVGEDEVKYAKAWEAFKAGKSALMIGTPLTMSGRKRIGCRGNQTVGGHRIFHG